MRLSLHRTTVSSIDLRIPFFVRTPAVAGGRWLLGAVLLAGLLTSFWLAGTFARENRGLQGASAGAALFFSVIIAYILPVYAYISERTVSALSQLKPHLNASAEQISAWVTRIDHKPVGWLVTVLAIGAGGGIGHNLLLFPDPVALMQRAAEYPAVAAVVAGTELVWVVITLVVAALIDNARQLAAAARTARIDLFNTHHLRPFATVAVISTLALIGAQAAFPIMFVDEALDAAAYIPGLIATGVPMVLLAVLPIWPVHQRIAQTKHRQLEQLSQRIADLPAPDPGAPDTLAALTPLLTYRRELLQVSEWPFDLGVIARLGLYLVIPPLTWVGAALIENLVETFL